MPPGRASGECPSDIPARSWRPAVTAQARVSRAPWPILTGNTLHWRAPRLGVAGQWTGTVPGISVTLLQCPQGEIRWHCRLPRADAELTIDGRPWRGVGYAEELSMTIAPWNMPFKTLRWGRFFSPRHALVWIDWRDGLERTWVFHNGRAVSRPRVRDQGVELDSGRLDLAHPGVPLRDAPVADTAFGRARLLGKMLPRGWSRAARDEIPDARHLPRRRLRRGRIRTP